MDDSKTSKARSVEYKKPSGVHQRVLEFLFRIGLSEDYRTASLRLLPALKAGTFIAGILIF